MRDLAIENYLKIKHNQLDTTIIDLINDRLKKSQDKLDEESANYYWFLQQVFLIQRSFTNAYVLLTKERFEDAWNEFDCAEIAIGYLEKNLPDSLDLQMFNISFIDNMIKEYQKLFPYKYFISRETIIKEEKCNICGQVVRIRNCCKHIPGKVYMGKLCLHIVTDIEIKALAIVSDPFDKYAVIHLESKEYNYGMLKYLLETICNPFDEFYVEAKKEKRNEYRNVAMNSFCPCGSGKKYKECHFGSEDELYDHLVVNIKKEKHEEHGIRFFNTWME